MKFVFNDGGRAKAGFKGTARDCVCRSICIATGLPYDQVYKRLAEGNATQRKSRYSSKKGKRSARDGINTKRKWFTDYMESLGFVWTPTMRVGQGCKVHLKDGELPSGRLVVNVSRHLTCMIDGVLHDTYDCSRDGERCVYGYWKLVRPGSAGRPAKEVLADKTQDTFEDKMHEVRIKAPVKGPKIASEQPSTWMPYIPPPEPVKEPVKAIKPFKPRTAEPDLFRVAACLEQLAAIQIQIGAIRKELDCIALHRQG